MCCGENQSVGGFLQGERDGYEGEVVSLHVPISSQGEEEKRVKCPSICYVLQKEIRQPYSKIFLLLIIPI